MQKVAFWQLPLGVKIAVGVAFGSAWMCIEGFIVEPLRLWRYMPFYKVGNFCVWDLAVASIIVLAIWRASRGGQNQAT